MQQGSTHIQRQLLHGEAAKKLRRGYTKDLTGLHLGTRLHHGDA